MFKKNKLVACAMCRMLHLIGNAYTVPLQTLVSFLRKEIQILGMANITPEIKIKFFMPYFLEKDF